MRPSRGRLCPERTAERREQLSTAHGDGDVPGRRAHGSGAAAVHAASPRSRRLVQDVGEEGVGAQRPARPREQRQRPGFYST